MRRINLLLADVPPMLGDIISAMAGESRLAIVAHIGLQTSLDEAVCSSGADVVLMSERVNPPGSRAEFLLRHPRVRMLALSAGGDRLCVSELVRQENEVRDVSPHELLSAILGEPVCEHE